MTQTPTEARWGSLQAYYYGLTAGTDAAAEPAAPALFFHGNGFSALTYNGLLSSLAPDLPVRAVDLQGHGRSDDIPSLTQLRNWRVYRGNVEDVLDRNGPAILMGHSMGALCSMFTAMKRPEDVRGLVLMEPVFFPPLFMLALSLARVLNVEARGNRLIPQARERRQYFDSYEQAIDYFRGRKGLKSWPEQAIHDYSHSVLRKRRDGQPGLELKLHPEIEAMNFSTLPAGLWPAQRLPMPVLVLRGGGEGSTVTDGRLRWLERLAPRLSVRSHGRSGHMLPVDQADWCAEAIAAWSSTLGDSPLGDSTAG